MYRNLKGTAEHLGKLIYARNDVDAFVAAFIYFYFFGDAGIIPVATLPVPLTGSTPDPHIRADNTISIGTHLISPTYHRHDAKLSNIAADQNSNFFSFENKPTFERLISEADMAENNALPELGRRYFYDSSRTLVSLMLEQLRNDHGLDLTSGKGALINQFFEFEDQYTLVISEKTRNKILELFPDLMPADFKGLYAMVKDPLAAISRPRQTAIERDIEHNAIIADRERCNSFVLDLGHGDVTVYNSDLLDSPFAKGMVMTELNGSPVTTPVMVMKLTRYNQLDGSGNIFHVPAVRLRFFNPVAGSGYDGLALFDNPISVVGSRDDAEWLMPKSILTTLIGN